jgi:hypothetical protein
LAFSPSTSPPGLPRSYTRLHKLIGKCLRHTLNIITRKKAHFSMT